MSEIIVRPAQLYATADQIQQRARRIQAATDAVDHSIHQLCSVGFEGHRAELILARYRRLKSRLNQFKNVLDHFAGDLQTTAAAFEKADRG